MSETDHIFFFPGEFNFFLWNWMKKVVLNNIFYFTFSHLLKKTKGTTKIILIEYKEDY